MENPINLSELFNRYIAGNCSAQEVEALLKAFGAGKNKAHLRGLIAQELAKEEEATDGKKFQSLISGTYQAIISKIDKEQTTAPIVSMPVWAKAWFKLAAASVILVIGFMSYIIVAKSSNKNKTIAFNHQNRPAVKDLAPGGNKAILTLANGSVITLDKAPNGVLITQGVTRINKLNDGQLTYSVAGEQQPAVLFNTLTTPRGGQYSLTLSDGTTVWLNAASSITFPTAFVGNERRVNITGEVYFEVAKNAQKPFYVTAGNTQVEVLGTHFNVNAYEDEGKMKTTLVEGSVKITAGSNNQLLSPGQQALMLDEAIKVSNVNTEEVIAWKNGWFNFNRQDIKSIMRQVSRWYDVEVMYKGTTKAETFTGVVSRSSNLSQVLMIMQAAGVKFTIQDRTITVIP